MVSEACALRPPCSRSHLTPEGEEENALAVAATGWQEALGASQVALQPRSEDQLL